jgi:acyl-CoA synthetase (AMP-forming)/AMP-acid ligase II
MDWSFPLRAACERNRGRAAIRYRGQTLTFGRLEQRIAELQAGLDAVGAARRRVAWMLGNTPEALELSMALARIGAISVPLNSRLSLDELDFILSDSRTELLVVDPHLSEAAWNLARRPEALAAPAALREARREAAADGEPLEIADGELATVIYTSGTTGFPKGVMRSHRANAWNVVNSALGSPRSVGEVELFNLPAFGIGLLHFALPALLGGATIVLDDAFDAARVWRLLADERVTRTFLAPTMISAMLEVEGHAELELPCLDTIYTAYEFPDALRRRAVSRFGDHFIYMYGLTEAQLTCTRPGEFRAKPTSVGGAMGALRVRVVGPDGRPLPLGEVGEIALSGPSTMDGYLNRPEETAQMLRDGWMLTGDLGRIDEDGDLHYAGRLKEMVKTGGFSVDPAEVERALTTLDEVAEAAVIGVPDEHWGEMVVAFVVCRGAFLERAVIEACRERLAGYKVPKRVIAIDTLPLNATGKVERGRLRDRFAQQP